VHAGALAVMATRRTDWPLVAQLHDQHPERGEWCRVRVRVCGLAACTAVSQLSLPSPDQLTTRGVSLGLAVIPCFGIHPWYAPYPRAVTSKADPRQQHD
jgi:hypothetical protein